ncbi:unnamed protein product [Auanema sp. JU1783]|nr:unnamed protein product [Auanema sp. JU1783]
MSNKLTSVSDCWDDLTLDTSRVIPQYEEEATEIVQEEFEKIQDEYDATILRDAKKAFAADLRSYKGLIVRYKTYDNSEPQVRNFSPLKKRIHFHSTPGLPRMRYFVHTENNFECADSFRLSHIPHIDDELDDRQFVKELRQCYTEGIHGADLGCGEYINDYMMYKLLLAVMNEWDREKSYIHAAIFKMFPNKYSFKELEENIFLTLKERFNPSTSVVPAETNKIDNNVQCLNHMLCAKCLEYDCIRHISSDSVVSPIKSTKTPVPIGNMITPVEPCGEHCYLLSQYPTEMFEPESEMVVITLKAMIAAKNFEVCKVAKVLNTLYMEFDEKPVKCEQWYHLIEAFMAETDKIGDLKQKRKKAKKKLSQRERYRIFCRYRSKLDNSQKMSPCKHEGPCHLSKDCECNVSNLICTKYCGCDETCVIKFPGCSCGAGSCSTQTCPCFLGKWECDPDMCKSCNCDILNIKTRADGSELPVCKNISLQVGLKKDIDIGLSHIAGWGCFIQCEAQKGELISEYTGEIISSDEAERRGRIYDKKKCSYVFRLNTEQSVDAGRVGNIIRFANHSDIDPNCESQIMMVNGDQRIGIYAKRRIEDGEELFFNYGYKGKNKEYVSVRLEKLRKKK